MISVPKSTKLSALEEENSDLTQVEIDEVFRLMGHIRTEVSSHNAMPCWVVLLVELLLDVGSDVLLDVVLLQSLKMNWVNSKST